MKRKISYAAIAGLLAVSILLAACGGSYSKGSDAAAAEPAEVYGDGGYAMEEAVETEEAKEESTADISSETPEADGITAEKTEQKLIYTCDMYLQTLNYDDSISYIREKAAKYDGLIESESESDSDYSWYTGSRRRGTRTMYFTLRIPTEKYQAFLNDMQGTGKILSRSSNVKNITKQYNDKTVEIEALKTQEERLLEMMDKAETIEDMITIESRLTEVQTQLNKYRSQLEQMDTDVAYSTVNLTIEEVVQYTETSQPEKTETFIDRLKSTVKWTWNFFLELLEGVLFFLIRMIPVLIVAGVLAVPVRAIFRAWKARKGKRSGRNDGNASRALPGRDEAEKTDIAAEENKDK